MKNDILKVIVQDIKKALSVLEVLSPKLNKCNDAEINLYTTTVHGMKSALLNIGETELSDEALKLEQAGSAGSLAEVSDDTLIFMDELRSVIIKHSSKITSNTNSEINPDISSDISSETDAASSGITDENKVLLTEKLSEMKSACERIQKKAAKALVDELKEKSWPHEINELLDNLTMHLLHGEFKKAIAAANEALEKLDS